MSGHVIGAFSTTAVRTSVIFSCDGSERVTCDWTNAAAASADASPHSATAAPAVSPSVRKNDRRSTLAG